MRVAVITPYYKEPMEYLRQCAQSVRAQSHPCTHIMVADGHPVREIDSWNVQHIKLPVSHNDIGNTPRAIGSFSAITQGFDALAFLDADNWYEPNHVSAMVELHKASGASVCTTSMNFHRVDGSFMFMHPGCDGATHADTSSVFLARPAFSVCAIWTIIPRELAQWSDRIVWARIVALGLSRAHWPIPTFAYRTHHEGWYKRMGESPPPGMESHDRRHDEAVRWWDSLSPENRRFWEQKIGVRIDTSYPAPETNSTHAPHQKSNSAEPP